MTLRELGLAFHPPSPGSVSILVGPNGSGKSSFMRTLADHHRDGRNIVIVCNTPHDRFSGLRGVRRISVGKAADSPKAVVKRAVAQSLAGTGVKFYHLISILEYCGYRSRLGFSIQPGPSYGESLDELRSQAWRALEDEGGEASPSVASALGTQQSHDFDLESALAFLQRHKPSERVWIDASEDVLGFSRSREFASVLKLESELRSLKVLRGIHVYLERFDDQTIEIQHASSGQLALISSLLFMIVSAEEDPIIIIDEPENSLHPNWQREYVDKVLTALNYRNATVIVATHAPLIVTGALATSADLVSLFEVREGTPRLLSIDGDGDSVSSIEEVLWRAFEVVTPANHFVSEQLVDEVSRFEKGQVSKGSVLSLIKNMEKESFDDRQQGFFRAVRVLLDKVEVAKAGLDNA